MSEIRFSVLDQLDQLEEIVLEGSRIPFSGGRLVNEQDIGVIKMEVSRSFGPEKGFLESVRKLASEKNIVLILFITAKMDLTLALKNKANVKSIGGELLPSPASQCLGQLF